MALAAACALALAAPEPAPVLTPQLTPAARPASVWQSLRPRSELATRTVLSEATRWETFGCGTGRCQHSSGWKQTLSRVDRTYRVLYQHDDFARVRVSLRDYRPGVVTERVRFPAKRASPFPIETALLEERAGVVLTVPAGSFTCTYRKVTGLTAQLLPVTLETWTDPTLPLPVKRVLTWRDPRAPEGYESSESTVLTSVSLKSSLADPERHRSPKTVGKRSR